MPPLTPLRFGAFELDLHSGELRRNGVKVRLADQPRQILQLLLERPGELVTREQLRERLWTHGTFVDFETGLNTAVRKLRDALDDSAANPRFIERVPRRGYRFIAPVSSAPASRAEASSPKTPVFGRPVRTAWIAATFLVIAAAAVLIAHAVGSRGAHGRGASAPARAREARAANPQAHELYLKGVLAFGGQSPQATRDAVGYFERAVATDSDFTDAYSLLAQAQFQFLVSGSLAPRDVAPKAEAAARKAIELDDTLAMAHRTLGAILHTYYWKWDDGDREFRRARELSGDAVDLHGIGFQGLIRARRIDEALAEAERVRKLDPRSFAAHINVAVARRASGQFDRAISELRRALELHAGRARGHFQLGVTFVLMGRPQDAIPELEQASNTSPGANPRFEAYLAYAYAAAGQPLKARRILQSLEARRRHQYVSAFGLALIHDALGDKAAALAAFERAYQERAVEIAQSEQYPRFTTIASEPQFLERMRSIGLRR
jgi:DNA-binding winged helix-turn-helix (wHTH) protein/tetratricopeptide (TPR) repeat protein